MACISSISFIVAQLSFGPDCHTGCKGGYEVACISPISFIVAQLSFGPDCHS